MTAKKHFHIYEGKLTKQHAWMHVLYGNELVRLGDTEKAEQIYRNGINMPASYEKAAEYKAAVSEISLFRALALKELSREDAAKAVLEEMASTAQNLIDNKDMRTYYGVGSPSPMPFELD